MAYHHNIGALHLRMLEDERYRTFEDSTGLTILLATDINTIIGILHVLQPLHIVDTVVGSHQIGTCDGYR